MLDQTIEPMKFTHLEEGIVRFADEDALEKLYISQWVHPIIKTALSHAQRESSDRGLRPPFVEMVTGGNAQSISGRKPDWAGIRTMSPENPNRTVNILPGDTKVSYKWTSTEIVPKTVDPDDLVENWFWPLRQIFTYCMAFKTRYGYIISDEEVVAIRVRVPRERFEESNPRRRIAWSKDRGTLEYMPIFDSAQGPGDKTRLTPNLGIFCLHLLAANDRTVHTTYRPLKDETLDGLSRAPTPPRQEETPAPSEVTAISRASPANTARSYDNVTESDAIISPHPSIYGLSSSSLAGPSESFATTLSSGSVQPKRKRDIVEPKVEAPKRRKGRSRR
ncbi:MAG: hypothetical protein Q9227_008327 [Pyrenula ochraceoflavens]